MSRKAQVRFCEHAGVKLPRVTRLVILVCGTQQAAMAEKESMAADLYHRTGLELSPEKSKITALTDGFEFLGCRLRLRWGRRYGYSPRVETPKARARDLRYKVKQLTGRSTTQ